ncbi:ABC transporter permease [Bacillus cereus]|nr:ABC transporter permease [Bacillus cereus]
MLKLRGGYRLFNIAKATFRRNKIIAKRAFPWTLIIGRLIAGFFAIIFPYFVYTFFLKGSISESFNQYTNQSDYITYITIGVIFLIIGRSTMMEVGRALFRELKEGTLESVLLTPSSRIGYHIGCLIEQLGRSFIQFLTMAFFGISFGANLFSIISLQSIVVIILTVLGFFSMALILSSIMLFTRDAYITQNTLFALISFVTGVSFPVEFLPKWLQYFSHLFPMTASLELFRSIVIDKQSISMHLDLVLEILLLSGGYLLVAMICLKILEKKLVENLFG